MVTHFSIIALEIPWIEGAWWATRVGNNLVTKQQQYSLCVHAFCLSIHVLMNTWVVSTFRFVNNAAVNIDVQVSI